MKRFGVAFVFSDGDIKDLKYFNYYEDAVMDYLERYREGYSKLYIYPNTLKILYLEDNKCIQMDSLSMNTIDCDFYLD